MDISDISRLRRVPISQDSLSKPISQTTTRKPASIQYPENHFESLWDEGVLLYKGKWGIVADFVLEENKLTGKEVLIDYVEIDDLSETGDSCLMIETSEVPWVKRGDTIKITIRDRARK